MGRGLLAVVGLLALPGALGRFGEGSSSRGGEVAAALAELTEPTTVAADPWTGLEIAAWTRHRPVAVFHQHGHPIDPAGLERLLELEAIRSPYVNPALTDSLLRKHGVGAVLLDLRPRPLEIDFGCSRGGELAAQRLAKFASRPRAFSPRPSPEGWALFAVTNRGGDSSSGEASRVIRPGAPDGVAVPEPDGTTPDGPHLVSVAFPDEGHAGETLSLVLGWRRGSGTWPVEAHLRLVAETGGSAKPLRLAAKLLRREGPRTRQRSVVAPFSAAWPAGFWPPGILPDTTRISLDPALRPGRYVVSAKVLPRPIFTRVGLGDLLRNADRWQGEPLGILLVHGPESGGYGGR